MLIGAEAVLTLCISYLQLTRDKEEMLLKTRDEVEQDLWKIYFKSAYWAWCTLVWRNLIRALKQDESECMNKSKNPTQANFMEKEMAEFNIKVNALLQDAQNRWDCGETRMIFRMPPIIDYNYKHSGYA